MWGFHSSVCGDCTSSPGTMAGGSLLCCWQHLVCADYPVAPPQVRSHSVHRSGREGALGMVPLLTPPSRLPTISCRYEDTSMAAGPGQQPSLAAAFSGPPWALHVTITGVFNHYDALRRLLLHGESFVGCQQQPHTFALPLWDRPRGDAEPSAVAPCPHL